MRALALFEYDMYEQANYPWGRGIPFFVFDTAKEKKTKEFILSSRETRLKPGLIDSRPCNSMRHVLH